MRVDLLITIACILIMLVMVTACAPQSRPQQDCTPEQVAAHTILKGLIIAKGGVFNGGC